jgi:hypothetical protein
MTQSGTVGAFTVHNGADVEEHLELLATADEVNELTRILVQTCGCGCSFAKGEFVSATPECTAVRALRDRRFVLGVLFARGLRRQLEAEEFDVSVRS